MGSSPSSSLPKQPKRIKISEDGTKDLNERIQKSEPNKSSDEVESTEHEKRCGEDCDVVQGSNEATATEVPVTNEFELNRESHAVDNLPDNSGATASHSDLNDNQRSIIEEESSARDDSDEVIESETTSITLPFPIRFFLEMQNNVRTLDIDDLMNNPEQSMDILEGRLRTRRQRSTGRQPNDVTWHHDETSGVRGAAEASESDSVQEEDADESECSENELENLDGAYNLSCTLAKYKTVGDSAKGANAESFTEGQPHPSVYWVRDRILQLDLPEILIDYLLYNRRYIFD